MSPSGDASPTARANACLYCEEPVLAGEPHKVVHAMRAVDGVPGYERRLAHYDCMFCSIVGRVGCQRGECPNCDDPPGMTKRESAKAAVEFYRAANGRRRTPEEPRS